MINNSYTKKEGFKKIGNECQNHIYFLNPSSKNIYIISKL